MLWPPGTEEAGGDTTEKAKGKTVPVPRLPFSDAVGQWPSFRGVGGVGVGDPSMKPPIAWDGKAGRNVAWKVKTPRQGYSSPIVWGNRLFLTGGDKESREIYSYDAEDGSHVWTAAADNILGSPAKPPNVTEDTGYAAACPVADGHAVYAIFATGDVLAVDFSGKRLWGRNLGPPDNPYGHASSLMVHRGGCWCSTTRLATRS